MSCFSVGWCNETAIVAQVGRFFDYLLPQVGVGGRESGLTECKIFVWGRLGGRSVRRTRAVITFRPRPSGVLSPGFASPFHLSHPRCLYSSLHPSRHDWDPPPHLHPHKHSLSATVVLIICLPNLFQKNALGARVMIL